MAIRAVVFDIGGVLEITPPTGWVEKWEARLHLKAGELDERRIYELACERLGVQPAEMIFLDDVKRCVAAARDCDIHAILYQNTAQAIADVEAVLHAHGA